MTRLPAPRRSVLFLSTTPPFPRDYGNRNRVHQTVSFFEELNFAVFFLLYPFDRDWVSSVPAYYPELTKRFEFFVAIPNSRPLHRNANGSHHQIDEWWDDNIAQYLAWLSARHAFDVAVVNYPFLSKAFEYLPKSTIRVLDTHDRFTGRRELFERHGVSPEFFYTSAEQEKIGFDRADIVIAIKHSETTAAREITSRKIVCIPYWDDRAQSEARSAPPAEFSHDRPLRLGFIGAYNSVNLVNLRHFLKVFARYAAVYNAPVEIRIAGNVCDGLDPILSFVTRCGYIDDVTEFYNSVDAVIAPLRFSTGLKIKVAEALAQGVPVLATRDAFDGFRSFHPSQSTESIETLCEAIVSVAYNETPIDDLLLAARKAGEAAAKAQARGFAELRDWAGLAQAQTGHSRRCSAATDVMGKLLRSRNMLDILDKAHHPKSQINRRQAAAIAQILGGFAGRMNLLVFGLGHDSPFWKTLNADGYTLFVEQSDEWISVARRDDPTLDVFQFDYRNWTVANSLPIDLVRLAAEPIPPRIKQTTWDAIVIDAPLGTHAEAPGRAVPIYWAQHIMARHTQVFVDDAERDLERIYCENLFGDENFSKISIPRATKSDRYMLWMARYV